MKNREDSVQELYERIKAVRSTLGVSSCKRTPTKPINEYKMPCVFIIEGVDELIKDNNRHALGYPSVRQLELTFEIIVDRKTDIRSIYRSIRSVVLAERLSVKTSFVKEIRTEGPTGYGLPDISGMNLVLLLTYADDGK